MRQSFKVCRVFGIDVDVHISLIVILAILAYALYVTPKPFGFSSEPPYLRLIYSILTPVAMFFFVLLHELGHSLVAMRFGSRVRAIVLFIFGGVALIENLPKEPKEEFLVAIAGPLTSLASAAVLYPFSAFQPIFVLAYFNLAVGLFNLIPAFPMDGGRILRSLLTGRYGYVRATEIAAGVGKVLSIMMAIAGFFFSIWLVLIALFVYIGASEEERMVTVESLLGRFKVRDVMTPNPICVSPDMRIGDVVELMLKRKHLGYPVTEDGKLIGIITLKDVMNADDELKVRDVMSRDVVSVSPDDNVMKVLRIMSERGIGRVPVVENGRVVGIVSRSDIVKVLEILKALGVREHRISSVYPSPS